MGTRIQRLTALYGTADVSAEGPAVEILSHAVYLPGFGSTPHTIIPNTEAVTGNGALLAGCCHPDGIERAAAAATYILVEGMVEHYGHYITDSLSRLWPLADWTGAPVKLLCQPQHGPEFWAQRGFLYEILMGLGLGLDDIVTFERPMMLPNVMRPPPSFRQNDSVDMVFGDLCRKIGRRYWSEADVDSLERPAYLSKLHLTTGTQHFGNEAELVAELDRLGVDILFPEEMTFADQVREFARRRVLMGPVGSAFHTSAFSAPGRRMIGLVGMGQLNSNYPLFDKISGCRATYYFVPATAYSDREGFGFSWTIPEPRIVAAQMAVRAQHIDRIDAYDREIEAEQARNARTLPGIIRRARRMARSHWSRLRQTRQPSQS